MWRREEKDFVSLQGGGKEKVVSFLFVCVFVLFLFFSLSLEQHLVHDIIYINKIIIIVVIINYTNNTNALITKRPIH